MQLTADPARSAVQVLRTAQSRMAEALPAAGLDPAAAVDVAGAGVMVAAAASVLKAQTAASNRLLDILA